MQTICRLYPNIEINETLLKKAMNINNRTFSALIIGFSKQQHLDKELNSIYYNLLCEVVAHGCIHSTKLICTIFPNVKIDIGLLKKAIIVESENDTDTETSEYCLQSISVCDYLLTTLFKQDETKIAHFTFWYDLFLFAVAEKKEKSQSILSPWLTAARKDSLNKRDNNHKIQKMDDGQMDGCICIECLKSGKNGEYCTKCNFFLCQGCGNQVMLFCCLYLFLLHIWKR